MCVRSDAFGFRSWKMSAIVAFETCKGKTDSSNLLATAVAFGMSKSNLKMVGEVVVVWHRELIKEFF